MLAKKILIVCTVVLVGVIYYYLYGDYFRKPGIHIQVLIRPMIGARMRAPRATVEGQDNEMVVFGLGKDYKLTSVELIPLADIATNKYPHAIWHLVTESNSVPTATFTYGGRIRGMHTEVKGAVIDPLQPSTGYRVVIKAGAISGQHDFTTPAPDTPGK